MQEWEQVLKGYRALKRLLRREAERFGFNAAEIQILANLYEGEKNVTQLSKIIGLGKSTITEVLDKLEEKGLIKRFRCNNDRRVVMVRITELGIQEYNKVREAYREKLDKVIRRTRIDCVLEFFKEIEKELENE
ncbi:MAG: MarR family transcriptional regulator [Sulfolobaceae archaeon]